MKYNVTIEQKVFIYSTITVEADNAKQAEARAKKSHKHCGTTRIENDDFAGVIASDMGHDMQYTGRGIVREISEESS